MPDPRFHTGDPAMDAALAEDDAKLAAMGAYDEPSPASLSPAPTPLCPCVEQERPVCGDRCWHFGNEYPPCRLCGAPDRTVAPAPPTPREASGPVDSVELIRRRRVSARARDPEMESSTEDILLDRIAALRAEVAAWRAYFDHLMSLALRAARSSAAGEPTNG